MITMEMREYSEEFSRIYKKGGSPNSLTRQMSIAEGMDFFVVDNDGVVLYPTKFAGDFAIDRLTKEDTNSRIRSMTHPGENLLFQDEEDENTTFYVSYLGKTDTGRDRYLTIKANTRPSDTTVRVISKQFPYIVFIVLIVGVIWALILAVRITKPFSELTESAKLLARGDTTVEFEGGGYEEIVQLSDSLNYATNRIKKVDDMRVAILANVSHDLKTPLTIIRSYAEMIKDITGDDKDMRDKNLDTIMGEIDRLESMVENILHVSKLESEMDEMHIEKVSLKELTAEIIEGFWVLHETEGVQFRLTGSSEGVIQADRDMIYQVIYNYISNAINHIGDDKTITINIVENRYKVEYSVVDKGVGIQADKIDQVWDRYYTDSDNYKRDAVGTGLGLHIVRIILERHGFGYGVESTPGEKTRFYFISDK